MYVYFVNIGCFSGDYYLCNQLLNYHDYGMVSLKWIDLFTQVWVEGQGGGNGCWIFLNNIYIRCVCICSIEWTRDFEYQPNEVLDLYGIFLLGQVIGCLFKCSTLVKIKHTIEQ